MTSDGKLSLKCGVINSKTIDSGTLHDGLVLGDLSLNLGFGLVFELDVGPLLLVVDGGLDLTLRLQSGDNVLVFPADLVGETSQHAELAVRLKRGGNI